MRLASHYFIPSLPPGAILILNQTQTATTKPTDRQTTIDLEHLPLLSSFQKTNKQPPR